ncbi:MAG: hypothetical protein PF637_07710 [Spirochaetes bacterium]|jgi:hypothetical protein|nr:hypothetical protein [Spirochaetota bacterium]
MKIYYRLNLLILLMTSPVLIESVKAQETAATAPVVSELSDAETEQTPQKTHPILLLSDDDWSRYIWYDRHLKEYNSDDPEENFYMDAFLNYSIGYGSVKYRKLKYKQSDTSEPRSRVISSGFNQERIMRMHMEGQINERIRVYIHHDSVDETENFYLVEYRALTDDEIVQEARLGNILININNSKYAIYESKSRRAVGFDTTLQKDNLRVKMFGTVFESESEEENFRGDRSSETISLRDFQYSKNRYYQIEPFIRYDNPDSMPVITRESFNSLITFTSAPADVQRYHPFPVNIQPGSLSVYIDDQDQTNNEGATQLGIDGGFYRKMSSGRDYSINYASGEIEFLTEVSDTSRIYISYKLTSNRPSRDPAVRTDIVPGKNFVFIKYGPSIEEDHNRDGTGNGDKNGDGRINYDIYERKSVYSLGSVKISAEKFNFSISDDSGVISNDRIEQCGHYTVDYAKGTVSFALREPLRALHGSNSSRIYDAVIPNDIYRYSRYSLDFAFLSGDRLYQLKHTDINKESVLVQINGHTIDSSLYIIDEKAGTIEFPDPNRPYIGADSEITISYDHSPFAGSGNAFLGGVRTDYRVNRNLSLGTTLLYSAAPMAQMIPDVGSEPESMLVLEADATTWMGPAKLSRMASRILGRPVEPIPFDVNGYFEVAHSRLNSNTYGKAMIDNMESSEEIIPVSLSEKDWQLSSLPAGTDQNERGRLNYKYYRSPSRDYELRGASYSPNIVDYSIKPGPYNIAESHIDEEDTYSLVLDFDFSTGDSCASVATSLRPGSTTDLSSLQYVEIYYKAASGNGTAYMTLDAGTIDEDSDRDGILDTEDLNRNGVLDADIQAGVYEDRGYLFNPTGEEQTRVGSGPRVNASTKGDGLLSTEDLNRNGILNSNEDVITFPGRDRARAVQEGAAADEQIRVDMTNRQWQRAVIYLDRGSSFSESARATLQQAVALRLSVHSDSQQRGVIYIGSLKLVAPSWQQKSINGVITEDSERFSVSLINSATDSEYYDNSFAVSNKDQYEKLQGNSAYDEGVPIEASLEIRYDALGGDSATATKRLARPINMMNYRDLVFWINTRSFTIGDEVSIHIGSSENDFSVYTFPLTRKNFWEEVKLSLNERGPNQPVENAGSVDLRNIRFLKIGVTGHSGRFWFNNLLLSGAETVTDLAYWVEGAVSARRSAYRTESGTELGKDFTLKYVKRGVGQSFVSPGRIDRNISEDAHELYSSIEIMPHLLTDASFIHEKTVTDNNDSSFPEEKRGLTTKKSTIFNLSYNPPDKAIRMAQLYCRLSDYDNVLTGNSEEESIHRVLHNEYAPGFMLEHETGILPGTLHSRFFTDLLFSTRDESSTPLEEGDTTSEKQVTDYQKRTTGYELQYRTGYFYLTPRLKHGSSEYVTFTGYGDDPSSPISESINYGFHTPFFHDGSNMKLFERFFELEHTTGLTVFKTLEPQHNLYFNYFENQFNDYRDLYEQGSRFSRSKSGESEVVQNFRFPFNFSSESLESLRNITVIYERKTVLNETGVPFEGETHDYFDEEYGVKRSMMSASDTSLNIFKYPPWYFFAGRGNCGNGRDHVFSTLNRPLGPTDDPGYGYTNSLMVQDRFELSSFYSFNSASASLFNHVSQMSERPEVQHVSRQMVQISNGINLTFDLMELFNFSFFRPNHADNARHSAQFYTGYNFTKNLFITENRTENIHSPSAGLLFGRNRKSISLNASFDFIHRKNEAYIEEGPGRPKADDKYYENIPDEKLDEHDTTYTYSCEIKSDVALLYTFFNNFYELYDYPMFTARYDITLNRYDYSYTVAPEPYDLFMLTTLLELDVHKNIRGGITGRWALEKYRNRETGKVYEEILSYEYLLGLTVLF